MFLTKKSFIKILIMAIFYFLLGSSTIVLWVVFNNMGINENIFLILGINVYFLGVIFVFLGKYSEGKGKLINLGNKLVRKELKPSEFLREYNSLKNSQCLILNRPGVEVLLLVANAYHSLNDRENALATVDEMIVVAKGKKKVFANLCKVSFLFDYGKNEEAELLFNEMQKEKLDIISKSLVDGILKSDRAMVMGDYKTVEIYNLNLLQQTFPKLDNLGKLIAHYTLGEVYENLKETDNAIIHYKYCVDFGGETAIKTSATQKLQGIN